MSARKHPPYGVKRNYRKIDIFHRADGSGWIYVGSTTWSRTCREAKDRFLAATGRPRNEVFTKFAEVE